MRKIIKGPEPPSLTIHRKLPHCNYENYASKTALRHSLVSEQRGICCYCMVRVQNGPTTMKIERWRSKAGYPSDQLVYRNLLGACLGGNGDPPHLQHCDTKKADMDLKWNPADPRHNIETRIHYEADGSIRSIDSVFDGQLNDVLNLNVSFLKIRRKAMRDGILDWWKCEKARIQGPVPREGFVRKRDSYTTGTGDLVPYCQVAISWLEQRLARMTA